MPSSGSLPRVGRFTACGIQEGKTYLMFLDDVYCYCLPMIFIGMNYTDYEAYTFKFTKDAEMEIDSDLRTGVLQKISKGIKSRKRGEPIRFVYDKEMPKDLLRKLTDRLNVDKNDTRVAGGRYHNFKDLMKFPDCGRSDLKYPAWPPVFKQELNGTESILRLIRKQDRSLHYPYQSFDTVIRVLREAAISKEVKSIKMTLYRLAKDSKVVKALICAAQNGKKVTVIIELLARFDEAVQHQLEQTHARGRNQSDIRSGRSENPLQAGTYRNTVWRPGLYQHRKLS